MKKILLSCLMLVTALSASAQDEEKKGTTEYVFEPHWYIQLQAGGQYTTGETDFGKLISPTIQGAVGYNFNKAFGVRLAINAWQGKGGYDTDIVKTDTNTDLDYKFTYFAPALNFTVNLSNIIAGVNPNRVVSFGAFVGGGLNIRSKASDDVMKIKQVMDNHAQTTEYGWTPMPDDYVDGAVMLFGQAGVNMDVKVSEAVSLGLEFNGNILSDKYNFKKAGNPDSYFNLLAGVKVNLGPTYSTRFIPAPDPEIVYVDKIVEKIVEVEKPAPVVEPLRRDIFFEINKTIIRDSEKSKIKDIADYLNEHQTAKVMITGYADAGTGNDRINDRLAAGRADVVVKALKEEYGVAPSRISYDSKGSRVQPFAENDLNRVSICIAE